MSEPTHRQRLRERFNISRFAIAYPWLTASFWLAVTVAGLLAFSSLKYALFPDVAFPVVIVSANGSFNTALETEAKLTQPLEQKLQSLEKLHEIRSSTYPSQAVISLAFEAGTNLEPSKEDVEAALGQLTLPEGATFKIIPLNLNESPAISYAIISPSKNLTELTRLAQTQIVPSIAKLPGILKVDLLGAVEEANLANTSPTQDSAEAPQRTSAVRFNGQDALAFRVVKQGTANTLDVVSAVENEVQKLQSTLPDVQLTLAATQADFIRESTQATIDTLFLAIILAVVVIFPFLWNWRATLISAVAIPVSLLGTFIVMAGIGLNLETITLLALALVIGIIVDDAIVDVENIIRHLENGEPPREAVIAATNEIGLTVSAATFTIVAVFLPVAFMGGVLGQFFKPFGITVSAAVTISWLAARTLVPLLAIFWLKLTPIGIRRRQAWGGVIEVYQRILSWSLAHRRIVVGLAVLSFAMGVALIPLIPKGFIPKLNRGEFNIIYSTALPAVNLSQQENLSLDKLFSAFSAAQSPLSKPLEVARQIEEVVLRSPEVKTVFTTVGTSPGQPNKGNLYIELKKERTLSTAELEDKIRQQLPAITDASISIEDLKFVETGSSEKTLQLGLLGNDIKALNTAAKTVKERIQKLPGFVDITATGEMNGNGSIFQIDHLDTRRVAYVSANLNKDLSLGKATNIIVAEAEAVLPPEISLELGGDSGIASYIFGSFGTTLVLSVVCILLVLIVLFKSWVDPLIILFSLPLALAGAMVALLIAGSEFSMIALIGIIFLLGIANKNAILLVDYINQLCYTATNRTEAILKAAPARLRPILMTTAATILGMLPIALGLGAGSELRSPMAITIIGGLVTSTLLSLLVVPVFYDLVEEWQPRFRKKGGRWAGEQRSRGATNN